MSEINTSTWQTLGPVSAYAFAVQHGYVGTEVQFGEYLANASTKAQQTVQVAEEVSTLAAAVNTNAQAVAQAEQRVSDSETAVRNLVSPFAQTYSNQNTYNVGDIVMYEDEIYVCTEDILAAEEWNPQHWDRSTVVDAIVESVLAQYPIAEEERF